MSEDHAGDVAVQRFHAESLASLMAQDYEDPPGALGLLDYLATLGLELRVAQGSAPADAYGEAVREAMP